MEFTFSTVRLYLQADFAPVVSVFVLLAFIKTNVSFTVKINRTFVFICIALLMLTASDNLRFFSANLPHPTNLRYISTGCGYILRPTILYLLTFITARHKSKKKLLIMGIPLVICTLFSILSILRVGSGIMFYFSEDNECMRGPFGFFSHILSTLYAFQIIYYSFRNYSHNKSEPIVVIVMVIAALFATVLEHSFDYDFVLSQTLTSSIIFYYFFLLTQTYKRDTLTGLLNRRCFYLEINHLLKDPMILLSMDLNNLKLYNDTQGHAAGDKALITVTEVMGDIFFKHAKLYRTGGDEFMAIFTKHDLKYVEGLVENFQSALHATEYRVACGVAQYTPGDNIEKVITLSDERMYSHKVKLKNSESFKKI